MFYSFSASIALNRQLLLTARKEDVRSTFSQNADGVQTSQNGNTSGRMPKCNSVFADTEFALHNAVNDSQWH